MRLNNDKVRSKTKRNEGLVVSSRETEAIEIKGRNILMNLFSANLERGANICHPPFFQQILLENSFFTIDYVVQKEGAIPSDFIDSEVLKIVKTY